MQPKPHLEQAVLSLVKRNYKELLLHFHLILVQPFNFTYLSKPNYFAARFNALDLLTGVEYFLFDPKEISNPQQGSYNRHYDY